MRFVALLFLVLSGLYTPAQNVGSRSNSQWQFSADARLVLIPTEVFAKGQPLKGLSSADFSLYHDGKREPISVFEEVDGSVIRGGTQNHLPSAEDANNNKHEDAFIVLLDYLNGSVWSVPEIRKYLGGVVEELRNAKARACVLILSSYGLILVHASSADLTELARAVEQWNSDAKSALRANGSGPHVSLAVPQNTDSAYSLATLKAFAVPETATRDASGGPKQLIDRREITAVAMQQIAESVRNISGRKRLIWLTSANMPFFMKLASIPSPFNKGEHGLRIDDPGLLALSDTNVEIYPVIKNVLSNADGPAPRSSAAYSGVCGGTTPGGQMMTMTGGRVCDDAPPLCVHRILENRDHYYMLGFYARNNLLPGWHSLRVRVGKPRVSVNSRTGFLVRMDPSALVRDPSEARRERERNEYFQQRTITAALTSPLRYTGLPVHLRYTTSVERNGPGVHLIVEMALRDLLRQQTFAPEVVAVVRRNGDSGEGRVIRDFILKDGHYLCDVVIPTGEYSIKVVVRDAESGLMGSDSLALRIGNLTP